MTRRALVRPWAYAAVVHALLLRLVLRTRRRLGMVLRTEENVCISCVQHAVVKAGVWGCVWCLRDALLGVCRRQLCKGMYRGS